MMDELTYQENLYCINCGEDEKLGLLGTYPTTDKYQCKVCNETFHVTSINEH